MTTEFTPVLSLVGGLLIGLSAVLLMATIGRIAGISGLVSALLPPPTRAALWPRAAFLAGLVIAPWLYIAVTDARPVQDVSDNTALMVAAGLLVGFGAVLGGGCTSGHGICGLARLSIRSMVAVLTFMATAVITVYVLRHVVGG